MKKTKLISQLTVYSHTQSFNLIGYNYINIIHYFACQKLPVCTHSGIRENLGQLLYHRIMLPFIRNARNDD